MNILDGDEVRVSANGVYAERDIVQVCIKLACLSVFPSVCQVKLRVLANGVYAERDIVQVLIIML